MVRHSYIVGDHYVNLLPPLSFPELPSALPLVVWVFCRQFSLFCVLPTLLFYPLQHVGTTLTTATSCPSQTSTQNESECWVCNCCICPHKETAANMFTVLNIKAVIVLFFLPAVSVCKSVSRRASTRSGPYFRQHGAFFWHTDYGDALHDIRQEEGGVVVGLTSYLCQQQT